MVFLVALGLRLAVMLALDTPSRVLEQSLFRWGAEPASLAHALYRGDGFGDVFGKGSGPSGWLTPVYSAVVALCFKLFGGVGPASATAIYVLHAIASATSCLFLRALGRVLGVARAGRVAAWAWACYPTSIWHSVHTVWDSTFIAMAVVGFFALLVRVGPGVQPARAFRLGLAYGAMLFLNPAPLSFFPVIVWYLGRGGAPGQFLARATAFTAASMLVCLPWMVRNTVVLGTPGMRSNLGVEFYVGNNDRATGRHQEYYHPSQSDYEFGRYKELGERGYAAQTLRQAFEWIGGHPWTFARLTLRRIQIFWVGESPLQDPRADGDLTAAEDPRAWIKWPIHLLTGALAILALFRFKRGTPEGLLLRGGLLLFPVPYYFTHVAERYRLPVDPLLVFLDVWLLLAWWDAWRRRRPAQGPGR